jgi:2-oxoglutarate dehydrogenase E1 component
MDQPGIANLLYLETVYEQYLADPGAVDAEWRRYFQSFNGHHPATAAHARSAAAATATAARPADAGRAAAATASVSAPNGRERATGRPIDTAHEAVAYLKSLPLFLGLPEEELNIIGGIVREVAYEPDEMICREGDLGTDLFIVTGGSVAIQREGEVIAVMREGQMVGELSVLDSRPRAADVIARPGATLLQIRGEDFQRLLERNPSLSRGLLGVLAARVRDASTRQRRVDSLVRAYRERGHVLAKLDPLGRPPGSHPELTLGHHHLTEADLDMPLSTRIGHGFSLRTLREILAHLQQTYCGFIGVQYMHIDDLEVQEWLRVRMEDSQNTRTLSRDEQIRILGKLTDAEVFETFLHRKFVGAKRFSLEGAESLIPLLDHAIEIGGSKGVEEVVIGMAHRGRLNVMANILGKPARQIFREFEDVDPERLIGSGDVKYHMGYSCDHVTSGGNPVHVSLCFNPSHLEFVGPVVLGRTRAKQTRRLDTPRRRVMPIIIHGDAAFAGQGVVQEMLNLSQLPGYATGGAVHIIVNNQIGFTTPPEEGRSSMYATDVARMLDIPVFHVNGEHPEAVDQVIRLAMEFREHFARDVVIDMYCYRRHGHNEGDDPTFTQPLLYQTVKRRPTVRQAYVENLLKLGGVTREEADEIAVQSRERLEDDLAEARRKSFEYTGVIAGKGVWSPYRGGKDKEVPRADTSVARARLQELLTGLTTLPEGFTANPKIEKFLETWAEMARGEKPLNWGAAESLAFASLLGEGWRVRLSGQDAGRGTFSHRHAMLHDFKTGQRYIPLCHVAPDAAPFEVWNSPLTEIGVLGFEYGFSLDYPDGLVIWEAQFGDFVNVAQVIIDQFITSAEDKWNRMSGIVLLLPHGFEGQGPEHSSARLERFLMLAAEDNIQVMNLTTPAQIFHCLRQQCVRPWRKPLVIMSPKSLLRHPEAVSDLADLADGRFERLIPDATVDPKKAKRVLFCSGKIYYELLTKRRELDRDDVAIVRLEQLYPMPREEMGAELSRYPESVELVWVQEEPINMGAWPFLRTRIGDRVPGTDRPIRAITRPVSASPATGSAAAHKIEQELILSAAFAAGA